MTIGLERHSFVFNLRRGTAYQWTHTNPILGPGEPGVEQDTGKFKIGNGTSRWTALSYFVDAAGVAVLLADAIENLNTTGIKGDPGDSAYEVAVANGFVGTQSAWLASLVGPAGSQGQQGIQGIQGPKGDKGDTGNTGNAGATGSSAYQIAVANGFVGNEAAWLASLVGAQGVQGNQGLQGIQGIQGVKGDKGDTGNQGIQGIQGVKGDTGDPGAEGDSAYDVAVTNGFMGTESAWLASLVGAKGDKGDKGDTGDTGAAGADYSGPTITVSSTAPSSPAVGDVWIDTSA